MAQIVYPEIFDPGTGTRRDESLLQGPDSPPELEANTQSEPTQCRTTQSR